MRFQATSPTESRPDAINNSLIIVIVPFEDSNVHWLFQKKSLSAVNYFIIVDVHALLVRTSRNPTIPRSIALTAIAFSEIRPKLLSAFRPDNTQQAPTWRISCIALKKKDGVCNVDLSRAYRENFTVDQPALKTAFGPSW